MATEVSSRKNPAFKRLRQLKEGAERRRQGRMLVEGLNGVEAACRGAAGLRPTEAWCSPRLGRSDRGQALRSTLEAAAERGELELFAVPDELIEAGSSTRTHQGVLAACPLPPEVPLPPPAPRPDLVVLGDLQDPGNVGTLWRSAAACGLGLLVQGTDGVDPFSPRVLRAAAGAAFQVPATRQALDLGRLEALQAAGYRLIGAAAEGSVRYDRADWSGPVALLVGREGPGLPASWLERCDQVVHIPMASGVESLNAGVCGSLLMYELSRGREFLTMESAG